MTANYQAFLSQTSAEQSKSQVRTVADIESALDASFAELTVELKSHAHIQTVAVQDATLDSLTSARDAIQTQNSEVLKAVTYNIGFVLDAVSDASAAQDKTADSSAHAVAAASAKLKQLCDTEAAQNSALAGVASSIAEMVDALNKKVDGLLPKEKETEEQHQRHRGLFYAGSTKNHRVLPLGQK
jgi:uncharacterized protein YicC (UPF0701 family)